MGNKTKQGIALSSVLGGIALLIAVLSDLQGAWNQIREIWSWFNTTVVQSIVSFFTLSIPLWCVILLVVGAILSVIWLFKWGNSAPQQPRPISPLFESPAKFREVWIDWYTVRHTGIGVPPGTVDVEVRPPLRCAKDGCNRRIAEVALIADGAFLVCEVGHFVGNEEGYAYWKTKFVEGQKQAKAIQEGKRKTWQVEYDKFKEDVEIGRKTEREFQLWDLEQTRKLGGLNINYPIDVEDSWFIRAGQREANEIATGFIAAFKEAREHTLFERKISIQQNK